MTAPNVGEVLAGKYRVERVLGQGGMGVVVQAMHLQLDERVAVKFLLPEYAQHPEASARFLREARAAVKIKSEHVARVIDVGTLESGAPYMVMEFLQGHDLSEAIATSGPLPVEAAVEHVLQACEAIAEAHAAGIVHRDLKPANLFLSSRADGSPTIKVLDFGISKITQQSESGPDMSLTKTSAMMGSPLYMSPEQMRSSRTVDARSDIWSLGAILYELLVGRTLFTGETLPEVCTQILSDTPPSLRSFRPDIPVELERAVFKCLEKSRETRYQSVAELAVDLAPFSPQNGRQSAERVTRVLAGKMGPMSVAASALSASSASEVSAATAAPSAHTTNRNGVGAVGTVAAWGQTGGQRPQPSRGLVVGALLGVVVLGGGAASLLLLRSGDFAGENPPTAADTSGEPESVPAPAAPASTAAAKPEATQVAAPQVPSVTPAPSASVATSAPSASATSSAVAVPIVRRAVPPRVKSRPAAVKTPREKADPKTTTPQTPTGTDLFGDRK